MIGNFYIFKGQKRLDAFDYNRHGEIYQTKKNTYVYTTKKGKLAFKIKKKKECPELINLPRLNEP